LLEKLVKIGGLGKFREADGSRLPFTRLTLVYGENATGKTTLTAILRSLALGRSLEERHSLGFKDPATITLRANNFTFEYADGGWNRTLSQIAVFDPQFISENVYSGVATTPSHRENLHRFAIGEAGVQLSSKIERYNDSNRKLNAKIREFGDALARVHGSSIPLQEFLNLPFNPNIESSIALSERLLGELTQAEVIIAKPVPVQLALPRMPDTDIAQSLSRTLPQLNAQAEQAVRQHMQRHWPDQPGEPWIAEGLTRTQDDSCPFCGQSIRDLALIRAYQSYFDSAYLNLKADIKSLSDGLSKILSQATLSSLQVQVATNAELLEYWSAYVDASPPKMAFEQVYSAWATLQSALATAFSQKAATPLEALKSEDLSNALARFKRLADEFYSYDEALSAFSAAIADKKAALASGDVRARRAEVDRLKVAKRRHDPDVALLCDRYVKVASKKGEVDSKIADLTELLQTYTTDLLTDYEARINGHLKDFNADFRLSSTHEERYGRTPRVNYAIELCGCEIPLSQPDPPAPPITCFANTLSSGDKSALALAFFLSRLDADPDLADKIVVLDDPFCSLDWHRRAHTEHVITDLLNNASQVIVLCHEKHFLRHLWDGTSKQQVATLMITRGPNGSVIQPWDIEYDTETPYYRNFLPLFAYLKGESSEHLEAVAGRIRPLLEDNLRFRFPEAFSRRDTLGTMLGKIREAPEDSLLHQMQGERYAALDSLNTFSIPYSSHGSPSPTNPLPLTDAELRNRVNEALQCL